MINLVTQGSLSRLSASPSYLSTSLSYSSHPGQFTSRLRASLSLSRHLSISPSYSSQPRLSLSRLTLTSNPGTTPSPLGPKFAPICALFSSLSSRSNRFL